MKKRAKRLKEAKCEIKSHIVFKNGIILDLCSRKINKADIAVKNGIIVGIHLYRSKKEIDCTNKFIFPGFVNSHVHIEFSLTTPARYLQALVKHYTTVAIIDPHNIVNVSRLNVIIYLLKEAKRLQRNLYKLDLFCVPATKNGAKLTEKGFKKIKNNKRVLEIDEKIDIEEVRQEDKQVYKKLRMFRTLQIDGLVLYIIGKNLEGYVLVFIASDHKSAIEKEVIEKLSNGMYIEIREGSAQKKSKKIIKCILKSISPIDEFGFCTYDKHIGDINKYRIIKILPDGLLAKTVNSLKEMGGCVQVKNNKVIKRHSTPICGLITNQKIEKTDKKTEELNKISQKIACVKEIYLFVKMSFLLLSKNNFKMV